MYGEYMSLLEHVKTAFQTEYPGAGTPRLFQAPGRVNLIGEHTDYNDGFVLPVAINFSTVVAATPRDDQEIHVYAADRKQRDKITLGREIKPLTRKRWANYVRGMVKTLLADGAALRGMNLAVGGNVPIGSGLSSSAAFEMAIGYALLSLSNQEIDPVQLALNGQKTENHFVGVNCGIMDQFISALGQENHALLIDCRDLSYRPVPIPTNTAIIIVDSGVKRGLVDSEYNARRAECEAAARYFEVAALRDLDERTFNTRSHELEPRIQQRARHVITENERTLMAAQILSESNMPALGPLMGMSHQSMQVDFEITVPAIDTLVEIMQSVEGVYGARMTGGGFGGCCVALAPESVAPQVKDAIEARYTAETGNKATFYVCTPSAGAHEITG